MNDYQNGFDTSLMWVKKICQTAMQGTAMKDSLSDWDKGIYQGLQYVINTLSEREQAHE